MHLTNKIEPLHVPVTFVNLLNDHVQLTKYTPFGSLQLYTKYEDRQEIPVIETKQIITEKENDVLPCIP